MYSLRGKCRQRSDAMQGIITTAAVFTFLAVTATTAEEISDVCSFVEKEETCTELNFGPSLPKNSYSQTLAAIADEVKSDFETYLRDTHGPYGELANPSIDYELNFFSASYNSSFHGLYDFVVLSSKTQIKPFGIMVLRDGKVFSKLEVSFGFSDYAVVETSLGIYFLGRDRFSMDVFRVKIN